MFKMMVSFHKIQSRISYRPKIKILKLKLQFVFSFVFSLVIFGLLFQCQFYYFNVSFPKDEESCLHTISQLVKRLRLRKVRFWNTFSASNHNFENYQASKANLEHY